jgi:hypothetical protein
VIFSAFRSAICLASALLLLAGCGDSLNLKPVTGTVTYNGKPVDGASVAFISMDKPVAIGTTDASGKFTLSTNGKEGAPLGSHKVTVAKSTAVAGAGEGAKAEDMMKMMQNRNKSAGGVLSQAELPLKYATPQGTELSAEVTADASKNNFEFALKD